MSLSNISSGSASSTNSFANCTSTIKTLAANQADNLLTQNVNRAYALIQNISSSSVTLVMGGTGLAALNKGIVLLPFGSYEVNINNLYTGTISAISNSNISLAVTECIK